MQSPNNSYEVLPATRWTGVLSPFKEGNGESEQDEQASDGQKNQLCSTPECKRRASDLQSRSFRLSFSVAGQGHHGAEGRGGGTSAPPSVPAHRLLSGGTRKLLE